MTRLFGWSTWGQGRGQGHPPTPATQPAHLPRLAALLQAVAARPQTPAELAQALGSTPEALEGMVQTLYAGGYVQRAEPGEGACACGPCSLKSLCRQAQPGAELPPVHLLRLTPRGEAYLARLLPA